jgi:two-component sensor histidine kinase
VLALKKDLQNRARTMALIHETLYNTRQYSNVDMEVYLTTLIEQVITSYSSPQSVRTLVEAKGVTLDLARATPIGLIINELVTNSLKYAFPQEVMTNQGPEGSVYHRRQDGKSGRDILSESLR